MTDEWLSNENETSNTVDIARKEGGVGSASRRASAPRAHDPGMIVVRTYESPDVADGLMQPEADPIRVGYRTRQDPYVRPHIVIHADRPAYDYIYDDLDVRITPSPDVQE